MASVVVDTPDADTRANTLAPNTLVPNTSAREAYLLEQDRRHARMHAAENQEYAFDNQVTEQYYDGSRVTLLIDCGTVETITNPQGE